MKKTKKQRKARRVATDYSWMGAMPYQLELGEINPTESPLSTAMFAGIATILLTLPIMSPSTGTYILTFLTVLSAVLLAKIVKVELYDHIVGYINTPVKERERLRKLGR